ncbi:dihydrodipicolinate synthase family protein [Salinigranum salinum]|uniref:dihydrodipicolinate synthase family protein n=1 Tax=Salinigranum salinum TaxID=1364937 RepID=UPI0012610D46|nr:dihydrodipicolinate synthase family protein [Salinigranum salinum]
MAYDLLRERLRDVATAVLTPFDDELEVDHAALSSNARAIADAGIGTILACANVSEYHSLSYGERIAVTETTVDALPDGTTVLAGAGGSIKTGDDRTAARPFRKSRLQTRTSLTRIVHTCFRTIT